MRTYAAIAGSVLFAAIATAQAADAPATTYPNVAFNPRPAYSWDGFYFGAHAGAMRNRHDFDPITNVPLFPPFLQSLFPFVVIDTRTATLPGATTENNSFASGGQLGINWQFGQWVLGAEGDITATRLTNSAIASVSEPNGGIFTATYTATSNWIGTTRLRLGFAWDCLLVYGTGGMAFGPTRLNTTLVRTEPTPSIINLAGPVNGGDDSGVQTGWTAGVGAEWGLTPAVSIGAEYRHIDLGTHTYFIGRTMPSPDGSPLFVNAKTTLDQATVRVNFRFSR